MAEAAGPCVVVGAELQGESFHSCVCGHRRLLKSVLLGGKRVMEMCRERKRGVG